MNKTIEFVEQNICECKNHIQFFNDKMNEYKKYPSFVKDYKERIEELKPILQNLEQIKCELEAWESVEPHLVDLGDVYVLAICNDDKEYLTLKKALEKYDEN